jgi:hypothetical protein
MSRGEAVRKVKENVKYAEISSGEQEMEDILGRAIL